MFPRRRRFSRASFPAALSAGKRLSSANFTAIIPAAATGYAVVVPKKIARLSVTRHRIKRQILSVLRATPLLPAALILFPRATVARMSYQDIQAELADILSKIR